MILLLLRPKADQKGASVLRLAAVACRTVMTSLSAKVISAPLPEAVNAWEGAS